jgi:hypothetical protein
MSWTGVCLGGRMPWRAYALEGVCLGGRMPWRAYALEGVLVNALEGVCMDEAGEVHWYEFPFRENVCM